MANYYVDVLNGNDTHAGTSFGTAYATIAKAATSYAAGDTVTICATGTYTLATTVTFTTAGAAGSQVLIVGANASGTVDGTQPLITSSTNSCDLLTVGNNVGYFTFQNLHLTHTAATRGRGIVKSNDASTPLDICVRDCVIDGCSYGIQADNSVTSYFNGLTIANTEIKNCTSDGAALTAGAIFDNCYIHNNTGDGVNNGGSSGGTSYRFYFTHCTLANNGGKGFQIKTSTNISQHSVISFVNCAIYNSSSDGIKSVQSTASVGYTLILENNVIYGNSGIGVNMTSTPSVIVNRNNAYKDNAGGNLNGISAGTGDVTLTANPFTSASTGDFSLNSLAGGGTLCKAAGFPGVSLFGTGYQDIGPLQHQDSGGGGGSPVKSAYAI